MCEGNIAELNVLNDDENCIFNYKSEQSNRNIVKVY